MSMTTRSRKSPSNEVNEPSPPEEDEVAVTSVTTPKVKDKPTIYALTPALISNEPIDYCDVSGASGNSVVALAILCYGQTVWH